MEPAPKPPPVVVVPVARAVPGQARPLDGAPAPTADDIEAARAEAMAKKPFEVIDAANQKAQASPMPDGYYNAIQVYDYMPGVLYQVYTAPLKITTLQFAVGEKVHSVAVGDSIRWVIGRTQAGSGKNIQELVMVKPVRAWLGTNMTITTDRRIYQLELHSYKESYMAAVSWNYPRDLVERYMSEAPLSTGEGRAAVGEGEHLSTLSAAVADLNFDYGFVVKNPDNPPGWMPLRVFDDGTKTYVHFPAHVKKREAPAFFVLSASGEPQIVNYRVQGDYYVVDRVFEMAELRLGEQNPVTVGIEQLGEGGRRGR